MAITPDPHTLSAWGGFALFCLYIAIAIAAALIGYFGVNAYTEGGGDETPILRIDPRLDHDRPARLGEFHRIGHQLRKCLNNTPLIRANPRQVLRQDRPD